MRYSKRNSKRNSKRKLTQKYKCIRINLRTKKYTRRNRYKKGGATTVPPGLPILIDKSNVMYTCTPIPTS